MIHTKIESIFFFFGLTFILFLYKKRQRWPWLISNNNEIQCLYIWCWDFMYAISQHKEVWCFFSTWLFNFSSSIRIMVFVSAHCPSKKMRRIRNFIKRLRYDKIWFEFSVGKQFHILCFTKAEIRWCSARNILIWYVFDGKLVKTIHQHNSHENCL